MRYFTLYFFLFILLITPCVSLAAEKSQGTAKSQALLELINDVVTIVAEHRDRVVVPLARKELADAFSRYTVLRIVTDAVAPDPDDEFFSAMSQSARSAMQSLSRQELYTVQTMYGAFMNANSGKIQSIVQAYVNTPGTLTDP